MCQLATSFCTAPATTAVIRRYEPMLLIYYYETDIANKWNFLKRRCVLGTHRNDNNTVQVTVQWRDTLLKKWRSGLEFCFPFRYFTALYQVLKPLNMNKDVDEI